jgi:hypothetical protein
MLTVRRARPVIFQVVTCSYAVGAWRFFTFDKPCGIRRYVKNNPVIPHSILANMFRHIGILHDECEALGTFGYIMYLKRGTDVAAIASIKSWDIFLVFKCTAGEFHTLIL